MTRRSTWPADDSKRWCPCGACLRARPAWRRCWPRRSATSWCAPCWRTWWRRCADARRSRASRSSAAMPPPPARRSVSAPISSSSRPTADGLNAGLQFAQQQRAAADALLVVPGGPAAHHPRGCRAAHRCAGPRRPAFVLAPSYDGGTNALLLSPPSVIAPAYGPHSADRHATAAQAAGATVAVVRGAHWALDLDSPEDIAPAVGTERRPCGRPVAGGRCGTCGGGRNLGAIAPEARVRSRPEAPV